MRNVTFGRTANGTQAHLLTLKNKNGMRVQVTDYGAALVSLLVPDRHGALADVIMGFDDVSGYEKTAYYMGGTIGRHAGQICNGSFVLNGKSYQLAINDHDHTMHGGPEGFHKQIFTVTEQNETEVQLGYISCDGEGGFPGKLSISVQYKLSDENELSINFSGICDADTILSMTNHAYFNLNGQDNTSVLDNWLKIYAEQYTEVDDQGLPTGIISPVEGTPFDFRDFRGIGESVDMPDPQLGYCAGYDHNWVLSTASDGEMRLCCEMLSRDKLRHMQIYSNQPGLQMYSGNYLDGSEKGKKGTPYSKRSAICLEPQVFPNGLDCAGFPSPVLRKGEIYRYQSVYKFL